MLFPFSFGNRGAAVMFEPKTYLARLKRELSFDKPTFLVVHLTAAHWPYYTAETPFGVSEQQTPEDRPVYRIGLRTADAMFDQVVSVLRSKGAFENAIVVVLSDHGEALILPNDAVVKNGAFVKGLGSTPQGVRRRARPERAFTDAVQDPAGLQVLWRRWVSQCGTGFAGPGDGRRHLAHAARSAEYPGQSSQFAGPVAGALVAGRRHSRSGARVRGIRFTETDLAVIPDVRGEVDEVETAKANSKFFVIDPVTTRMHIRHRMLPLVRAFKERAAFTTTHLLGAMPAGPNAHQYVYFDLATGNGELLLARPGPELPEGQRLWDALHEHFAGELKPPTRTTIDQWPTIAAEWRDFFIDKKVPPAATIQVGE